MPIAYCLLPIASCLPPKPAIHVPENPGNPCPPDNWRLSDGRPKFSPVSRGVGLRWGPQQPE
ncbi:MAG: hypothetical protein EA395_10110 [Phormidium sp. GEM2.Bin31]|nr:MAG: hypothetical protein EA395_10110 [Phormidium sp. GEM2.Bin31]